MDFMNRRGLIGITALQPIEVTLTYLLTYLLRDLTSKAVAA